MIHFKLRKATAEREKRPSAVPVGPEQELTVFICSKGDFGY